MTETVAPSVAPALDASATWYARKRSWAVLAVHGIESGRCTCGNPSCDRVAKHPAHPRGVHGASRDPATVETWWAKGRPWGVGIACGAPSGVWVLDVDGAAGMGTMAALEREHGALPTTITARTGGGGLHLFWLMPSSGGMPSRVRVADGVDVRGDGGFVVAPPSMHASGRRYEWHDGRGPHQVKAVAAPTWLVELARGGAIRQRSEGEPRDWANAFAASVGEGERNHAVAERAGYLLRAGVDRHVAAELLADWAQLHCKPPLDRREVRRTVASIGRREERKRRASR